ncbi:MAG TPA: ATPase P, partial [Bifidobacterium sp.]|nr:ATPase P [Bifidobacterium sp.]
MGFDLFMAAVAIVIAAIATWGILKVLLGADTEADAERARSGAGEIAVDATGSGSTTSHDAASANAENSGESGEI